MRSNFTQFTTPQMRVLSDDQITSIYLAALEILERTGMKIDSKETLQFLADHGALVGPENRVRIPAYLVERALKTVPPRVVLCNRDGERKLFLEDNNVYFGCNPDNPDYIDPYTGVRRPMTSLDGKDMATVIDYCYNIEFVLNACFSADVPRHVADRVIIRQMMLYMRKPIGFSCTNADSLLDIIDMAAIVAGGYEELRMNPYIFHIQEPISPLSHDGNTMKEIKICAEKGVPLVYYPMPMAGATAPATLAGMLAQNLAEAFTGMVVHQLTKPGAPFISGGVASIMDMKTTRFSYGAPEMSLSVAALTDILHYFKIPVWGTAGCVDSKTVDQQAAAEIAISCLMSGLSGANLIHDTGLMDQATVTCPEVLLLADEIQGMVRRILKGIPVTDETLALDVVNDIGNGGSYITHEHTYKFFREFWVPSLFDRSVLQKGQTMPSLSERLNEKARYIIENHEVPALPSDKLKDLLELEKKWLG
ncbi:MAG: trimethylamine methyltransferase family protein [Dehalobacterium sp.]